jgi:S-formylglutathione hydrolase FrmB
MKNNLVFSVFWIFISTTLFAQNGTLKESLSLESEILGKKVEYSVYFPSSYNETNRKYPVLYLLHGYTDDETGWTQFGEVQKIADEEMQNLAVTDMIIAMPDGGLDWYVNSYDGKTRYEDFFIQEFIPHIEKTFRAKAQKQFRAIAGLSMGGHGAFLYALKYPDMFAAACPLSAAIWEENWVIENKQEDWDRIFGFIFGENTGEARLTEHLKKSMPYFLLQSQPADQLKKVKWYIDCGDDDFLIEGNMDAHRIMREREIPHEFRVRDGGHTWEYWRTALPDVLKFISVSFHR